MAAAAMVAGASFKKNKNGEEYASMVLEDATDKAEALLMATSYDQAAKQKTRPCESYRHLAAPGQLLVVTGELRVETADAQADDEADAQAQIKVLVRRLEPLSGFQGRGLTGALVELPPASTPPGPAILGQNRGPLPLTLEYGTRAGAVARAGPYLARSM